MVPINPKKNFLVYDSRYTTKASLFKIFHDSKYKFVLLKLLVRRDLKTRYQRSFIGIFWSILNPTLTALILFSVFRTQYAGKFNEGVLYGPYVLSGTLVLALFGSGVVTATQSFQSSAYLFTKLAAPTEVFALSASIGPAINLFMGLIPLTIWNLIQGGVISKNLLFLPIFGLLAICYLTGLALLNFTILVRFGDYLNVLSLGVTLLTFLTPIFYPIESVSRRAQIIIQLNPVTHFVNAFRFISSGTGSFSILEGILIILISFSSLIFGFFVFNSNWQKSASFL